MHHVDTDTGQRASSVWSVEATDNSVIIKVNHNRLRKAIGIGNGIVVFGSDSRESAQGHKACEGCGLGGKHGDRLSWRNERNDVQNMGGGRGLYSYLQSRRDMTMSAEVTPHV